MLIGSKSIIFEIYFSISYIIPTIYIFRNGCYVCSNLVIFVVVPVAVCCLAVCKSIRMCLDRFLIFFRCCFCFCYDVINQCLGDLNCTFRIILEIYLYLVCDIAYLALVIADLICT